MSSSQCWVYASSCKSRAPRLEPPDLWILGSQVSWHFFERGGVENGMQLAHTHNSRAALPATRACECKEGTLSQMVMAPGPKKRTNDNLSSAERSVIAHGKRQRRLNQLEQQRRLARPPPEWASINVPWPRSAAVQWVLAVEVVKCTLASRTVR